MHAFINAMGLETIGEYCFAEQLSGGGSNFTAIYTSGDSKAVAKFFFSGPVGAGDIACHRELKMLKLCSAYEDAQNIKVAPAVIQEFAEASGFITGFLMEYIEGKNLWEVMSKIPPGDTHSVLTTFYRIGWARHNSMKGTILHRDLHPGNILFEMDNEEWEVWVKKADPESPRVRFLDFGSAVMPMQFGHDTFDADWYRDLMRNYNGAFTCVAPEFFTKRFWTSLAYAPQAFDCWALGLLLYRICVGESMNIAATAGEYCDLIHSNLLLPRIIAQIAANVADPRLQFLLTSMLQPDYRSRVELFSAIEYAGCLWRKDPRVVDLRDRDLREFVYTKGCDFEYGLPPDQRSNSGY